MQGSKYKNLDKAKNSNGFSLLSEFGAQYLKKKMEQISVKILPENIFEKTANILFKEIYQKNAQKIALDKFSEINKIAQQISEKEKNS